MMIIERQESLRERLERSNAIRSTAKQFYIYVFLFLIIVIFSVVKLGQVEMFGTRPLSEP